MTAALLQATEETTEIRIFFCFIVVIVTPKLSKMPFELIIPTMNASCRNCLLRKLLSTLVYFLKIILVQKTVQTFTILL